MMGEHDEHYRDAPRIPVPGGLSGEVMVYQPHAIYQISRGGMEVETSFALHLDSLHDFRLTLGERSVVVKGRIVHSHIANVDQDIVRYRSGVQFVEPSAHVLAAIDEFLEVISRSHPSS